MKKRVLLSAVLSFVLPRAAVHAAIPVTGGGIYTQNFDSLPTAAALQEFSWTDDVTLPGFYLHRSNSPGTQSNVAGSLTNAGSRPYISNGATAANGSPNFHGFLSLGPYGSTERALGSCPTGTDGTANWSGGTLSTVAIYTNTSPNPVRLTQLRYDLEVARINSELTTEAITLTWKMGTAASLLAELAVLSSSATFQTPGYQQVSGGLDFSVTDGFTALNATPSRSITLSGSPAVEILVPAGQSLALRWANANDTGTDAQVGIDNLAVTFSSVGAIITPATANPVRNDAGTPLNPADDTVSFDLTVTGTGAVSPAGWRIIAPAALAGTTGAYGASPLRVNLGIAAFTGIEHAVDISVADQVDGGITGTARVEAPWCRITPSLQGYERLAGNPATLADDLIALQVRADAVWSGPSFDLVYGSTTQTTPYPGPGTVQVTPGVRAELTVRDTADPSCSANLIVQAPGFMGYNHLASSTVLSLPYTGERSWTFNNTEFLMIQTAATQVDHVVESEVISLPATTRALQVEVPLRVNTGGSSGFEAADYFRADLIIDGGEPVSILGRFDVDGDGRLEGAASNNSINFVELPDAGDTDRSISFNFVGYIPPGASTVQVRITGNSNSSAESFFVESFQLREAPPTLSVTPAGPAIIDNRGTITPDDDTTMLAPFAITTVNMTPAQDRWVILDTGITPSTGLYSAPNPVTLRLNLPTDGSIGRVFYFQDNENRSLSQMIEVLVPARSFFAALASPPNIVRNLNGPGTEDDTLSFDMQVRAPSGGPEFRLGTGIGTATANSRALSSELTIHRVTLSHVPSNNGNVYMRVWDASYPASAAVLTVPVNSAAPSIGPEILGRVNFGSGVRNLMSSTGNNTWLTYPGLPGVSMNNRTVSDPVVSETLDLTAVGEVLFTATVLVSDSSTGFEDSDAFGAALVIDNNPESLTTLYDQDVPPNGLQGDELAGTGGTLAAPVTRVLELSKLIPASADSVYLTLDALTNSSSEQITVLDIAFQLSALPIRPGNGTLTARPGIAAKMSAATLAGLATGGSGPISISGVQPGATLSGATVALQDGWIIYQPLPGATGVDTFRYTLTDGTSSVDATVIVSIQLTDAIPGLSIAGVVRDGETNRIAAFAIPGRSYRLEYSADLNFWVSQGNARRCPDNGLMSFTDPGPLPPVRFYRLVEQAP